MTDLPSESPAARAISVTELNRQAKRLLEDGLGKVWVEGEVSNLSRPASGHIYFSLKDDAAQLRCAWFRGRQRGPTINLKNGDQMLAFGQVSIYEARGDYQMIVEQLEAAGEGELLRRFEALKKKLAAEGLFDGERKSALPALPSTVGVVTSPTGAAVQDIVTVLGRRFPSVRVIIYPTAVQGELAARQVAYAIETAAKRKECEVLIVGRGGGSLEDLWPFNEEVVARAIAGCPIPVVSAVGHETDVTIADFVADVRAPDALRRCRDRRTGRCRMAAQARVDVRENRRSRTTPPRGPVADARLARPAPRPVEPGGDRGAPARLAAQSSASHGRRDQA